MSIRIIRGAFRKLVRLEAQNKCGASAVSKKGPNGLMKCIRLGITTSSASASVVVASNA
jgi:hypothetical protein